MNAANLVWLWEETADFVEQLMGHYNHPILVDANFTESTNSPIIGEQVVVSFVAQ